MTYSKMIRAAIARTRNTVVFDEAGDDPSKPNYACAEYLDMLDGVQLMRTVYGGTMSLREAGKDVLPKHPMEKEGSELEGGYQARRARAVCYNQLKRAIGGLVGMIFRRDVVLEDVPDIIAIDLKNIDQQGSDLSTFAKRLAEAALRDGLTWLHEEYPVKPATVRSRADERMAGLRPYWTHVSFEDAINWRYEFRGGAPELTLFVYRETTTVADGEFGQQAEVRYRVLRPGSWEVWVEVDMDGGKEFRLEAEGPTSLSYIPVDPIFGPERTGPFTADPPLLDVAYEQIEHYRVRSDYQHALSFASQPIPWLTGHNDEGKLAWSSDKLLVVSEQEAKLGILESQGVALNASVEELRRIEGSIAAMSLSMLLRASSPGAGPDKTATGELIDKAEGDSELSTFARSLQAALNSGLQTHGEYRGIQDPGRIIVNKDFSALMIDPNLARVLLDMVNAGKLSAETMWQVLQTYEVLPDGWTADEELARIEAENGRELSSVAALMAQTRTVA